MKGVIETSQHLGAMESAVPRILHPDPLYRNRALPLIRSARYPGRSSPVSWAVSDYLLGERAGWSQAGFIALARQPGNPRRPA